MVQFGKRFESAQKGRWQRHNADYERLKLLLALATKAHERAPSTAHVSNYGDAGGGDVGLLAKAAGGDGGPPPGSLDASLSPTERKAPRRSGSRTAARGPGAARVAQQPEPPRRRRVARRRRRRVVALDAWLFSSKMPESYPLLVHGFDVALVAELAKVEALYARELDVLESRWQDSLADDDDAAPSDGEGFASEASRRRRRARAARTTAPWTSLAQLDADARELVDFTVWNFTAFTKITKKRDKKFKHERPIRERFCAVVRERDCWAAASARSLLADVHARYAELFTDGDATEAQLELRETTRAWTTRAYMGPVAHRGAEAAWPVFRVCGVLLAWHWLWGVSLHVWSRFRVNAQFLFDVVDTPRQPAPTASDVFDECILETNVLLGLLLVYYKSTYRGGLPKFLHDQSPSRLLPVVAPLLLIVFVTSRLVFPWQRRRPMWGCLARIVRAPFCEVRFVDTYVADVLTSMAKVWLDVLWVSAFLGSGACVARGSDVDQLDAVHAWTSSAPFQMVLAPAVCVLPVWFRFAQCLRKYRDVGDSAARWVHFWNAGNSWYRFAAAFDVFGRFVWLATLVPPTAFGSSIHEFLPDYLTPVLARELARRCVWGFFRLENEHISNAFMHRREGNSVPSHLRRAPKKEPNKRALSIVEAVAIAVLVITLLTRMTLAKRDAEYHLHHDHAPNDGVPNATLAPRAADDDDALRVYDDAAVHHHHHSGHHCGVSFDDDDDSVPKAVAFDDDDDRDVAAAAPTFNYR
ncbi:hypothetical protein JL720_11293 [Aureococcus anophagefferens]|nr:hypothetical protein JL720_11293 [Aureococcus anophagefferens]